MVGWLFDQLWIFLRCTLVMFRSWRSRYSKSTLFQTCSQHLLENCHSVAQHFLGVECEKLWLKTGVKDRAGFILIYSLQPSPGPSHIQVLTSLPCISRLWHNKCIFWYWWEERNNDVQMDSSDSSGDSDIDDFVDIWAFPYWKNWEHDLSLIPPWPCFRV